MDISPRKFTAFISYRHKPLDMAVAEELIKLIERYRVPKELRKDGNTSLGSVFRDRDELGVHHDLEEAIYPNLDNSEFLIVVCTPDTKDSEWIPLEIERFLQNHNRDHILVVHAAGTAEEAIPEQITHVYDENGTLVEIEKPLSIFLADANEKKVLSNLRKEFLKIAAVLLHSSYESLIRQQEYSTPRKLLKEEILRLIAAFLGCPYDELVQRNKKYLYQRLMVFSIVVASFLLIFAAVVIHKNLQISDMNQQIQEQLRQTQLNESAAMALTSQLQLAANDRLAAIQSAMAGLSSDESERPYSASAHAALADALYVYGDMVYRLDAKFEQYEDIESLYISENGQYLVAITQSFASYSNSNAFIRCYDLYARKDLWSHEFDSCLNIYDVSFGGNAVYCACDRHMHSFDLASGEQTLMFEHKSDYFKIAFDKQILVSINEYTDELRFFDLTTGALLQQITADYLIAPYSYESINYAFSRSWPASHAISTDESTYVSINSERITIVDMKEMEISHVSDLELDSTIKNSIVIPLDDDSFVISYHCENIIHVHHLSPEGELVEIGTFDSAYLNDSALIDIHLISNHLFYLYGDSYLLMDLSNGSCDYYLYYGYLEKSSLGASSKIGEDSICLLFADGSIVTMEYEGGLQFHSSLDIEPDYQVKIQSHSASTIANPVGNNILVYRCIDGSVYDSPIVLEKYDYDSIDNYTVSSSGDIVLSNGHDIINSYLDYSIRSYFGPVYDLKKQEATDLKIVADEGECIYVDGLEFDLTGGGGIINGFTADESKVIVNDELLLDINAGEFSLFEDYAKYSYIINSSTQYEGKVLTVALSEDGCTLHWWEDGTNHQMTTIPGIDDADFWIPNPGKNGLIVLPCLYPEDNLSADYYLIYSIADDTWKEFRPDFDHGYLHISTAKKEIVLEGPDNKLYVYDFDTNDIIRAISSPVPSGHIWDFHSLQNDQYYLIVTYQAADLDYYAYIINAENGNILFDFCLECGKWYPDNLCFAEDPTSGLLFFHEKVIDTKTWTSLYNIPGMIAYLPSTHSVLCDDYDSFKIWPLYNVDDLIEMGQKILGDQ